MACELKVQYKQPADVLYYDVSFSRFLASYGNDTIASVAVLVDGVAVPASGPGLHGPTGKAPSAVQSGKVARAWFAGGVVDTDYRVSVRVTTVGDLVKEYDFVVAVRDGV